MVYAAAVKALSTIRAKGFRSRGSGQEGAPWGGSEVENVVETMYTSSKCSSGQWQQLMVNGSGPDAICGEVTFMTKGLRCVPCWVWLRERVC